MAESRPEPRRWFRHGQLIQFIPLLSAGIVLIVLPVFLPSHLQIVMTKFLIFALFAISFDLIFGYAGLLSLGHAAYFGAGGYTVAVLMLRYDINSFWIGVLLGLFSAALVAALFGLIVLRVSGLYFLLLTFALGQLLYSVAWNWKWLNSPGMQGIAGLSFPDLGFLPVSWNNLNFYYFVLLFFALSYFILRKITNSPFGHALVGIREGEARMQSLGYHTWLYKYLAFVIAGTFAGLAGIFFAYHNRMIAPGHFGVTTSFLPMAMAIIGGSGTLFGPVIGAAMIVFVEYFASIVTPDRWPLILGSIFVLSIMYVRDGIGVYLSRLGKKVSYLWGKH
ncbi:MAG: branched-chain amino acid ABC transporter permease [Bacillota bacterium]